MCVPSLACAAAACQDGAKSQWGSVGLRSRARIRAACHLLAPRAKVVWHTPSLVFAVRSAAGRSQLRSLVLGGSSGPSRRVFLSVRVVLVFRRRSAVCVPGSFGVLVRVTWRRSVAVRPVGRPVPAVAVHRQCPVRLLLSWSVRASSVLRASVRLVGSSGHRVVSALGHPSSGAEP